MSDALTVFVANGTVLHHTSRWGWGGDIQLYINGESVPHEFPQALPPGYTITARRITNELDHYLDKDGKDLTSETYEAEQSKHRDHDGEFLSDEDELAWRIYQKGIKPVYKPLVEDVKVKVVEFRTILTGEEMITCAPSYGSALTDNMLEKGDYFSYEPDEVTMLRVAINAMGMDKTKLKAGQDIRSSLYDGHSLASSDPHFSGIHAVTLEAAKKLRDAQKEQVYDIVRKFKASHDPRPVTNGEFYKVVESAVKDFAKCKVLAASRDMAGAIQRRLKELLRRMDGKPDD